MIRIQSECEKIRAKKVPNRGALFLYVLIQIIDIMLISFITLISFATEKKDESFNKYKLFADKTYFIFAFNDKR